MEIFVEFILSVHREMSKSVENCLPTSYSNRPNQANSLKIFWAPVQSINTSLLNALEYSCKTNIFCIVDLVCHHWCLILFYLYFWTDLLSNPCCFDPQWHQARYDCKFLGGQKLYSATVEIDNLSIQDAANRGPFSLWSRETLMEKNTQWTRSGLSDHFLSSE